MLTEHRRLPSTIAAGIAIALIIAHSSCAADAEKDGDWIVERDDYSGNRIQIMELTLHPRAEPTPALKYRLIPSEFDRVEGNAALYYLKALGFLEQSPARERVTQFTRESREKALEEGKASHESPPSSWLTTAPHELPKEKVNEYLSWLSFQPPLLADAARRRVFDMDRRIREVENPIMYLLPEIQSLREIARTQSIRCRLAIAEERIADAIEILGEQYALANHLGQDEFIVSNLVGASVASIAFPDALHLIQQAETPNLYWALAALPDPLIPMRRSYAFEQEFLFEQLKVLREVTETPRPAGYWQNFIDRLLPQSEGLGADFGLGSHSTSPELRKAFLVAAIGAAYPGAKGFLIEQGDIEREVIESYPTAQTVFLAVRRFHEQATDNFFKWNHIPYWQAEESELREQGESYLRERVAHLGWAAVPTNLFLPALHAARTAQQRSDQLIALLQTLEAIRAYGAIHGGKLPGSLRVLELPAPIDPLTGQPISYELHGDRAILSCKSMHGLEYRLIIRLANK